MRAISWQVLHLKIFETLLLLLLLLLLLGHVENLPKEMCQCAHGNHGDQKVTISLHMFWTEYHKILKTSPRAYIFQRPFLRRFYSEGLSTEGNLLFQIDWASLIIGSKFTIFALFYFVFEGNYFPSTISKGGLHLEGRFHGRFIALPLWGLMHGGAYFRNFTVCFYMLNLGQSQSTQTMMNFHKKVLEKRGHGPAVFTSSSQSSMKATTANKLRHFHHIYR